MDEHTNPREGGPVNDMADGIPDDGEGIEIDLRDGLIFAAGSLAADFGEGLPTDRAEELVFSSADRLLAVASVTEFVPILAERDARRAIRSGGGLVARAQAPVPTPRIAVPTPRPAVPAPRPAVPAPMAAVPVPRPGFPAGDGPSLPASAAAPPARPAATRPVTAAAVAPLVAVPDGQLTRLRDRVEQARQRVAEWQAELTRR